MDIEEILSGLEGDERDLVAWLADMNEDDALALANRMLFEDTKDPLRVLEIVMPVAGGAAVIPGLGRLGGRTVGVLANDPGRAGGWLDADAADKGAAFGRAVYAAV